jgi:hypothetical protein
MKLCAYSEIFGKPNIGVHSYRLFNIAIVDVIGTIMISYLIYWHLNKKYPKKISFSLVLIMMFILGIIMHRIFCVRTTIDKLLFDK